MKKRNHSEITPPEPGSPESPVPTRAPKTPLSSSEAAGSSSSTTMRSSSSSSAGAQASSSNNTASSSSITNNNNEAYAPQQQQPQQLQRELPPIKNMDPPRFIDISGYWLGDYGDNGIELVEIVEDEDCYVAWKITGDKNVPAHEISFYVKRYPVSERGFVKGEIQVAHVGFMKPRWVEGELRVLNADQFMFQWGTVRRYFTRADISEDTLQSARFATTTSSTSATQQRGGDTDTDNNAYYAADNAADEEDVECGGYIFDLDEIVYKPKTKKK